MVPFGVVSGQPERVAEGLARPEHRLLADDARPAHLLQVAVAVDDLPVPRLQLHAVGRHVGDLDRVGEEVAAVVGRGFLFDETRQDGHADPSGHRLVHRVGLDSGSRRQSPSGRGKAAGRARQSCGPDAAGMLDRFMRRLVDPALERAGRRLADGGVGADALTVAGLGIGLAAARPGSRKGRRRSCSFPR